MVGPDHIVEGRGGGDVINPVVVGFRGIGWAERSRHQDGVIDREPEGSEVTLVEEVGRRISKVAAVDLTIEDLKRIEGTAVLRGSLGAEKLKRAKAKTIRKAEKPLSSISLENASQGVS